MFFKKDYFTYIFLVTNLRKHLLDEAQRLSECVSPLFINDKINITPLLLWNTPESHFFTETKEEQLLSSTFNSENEFPQKFFYFNFDNTNFSSNETSGKSLPNVVAVIGNTGVGKTTFFKSLLKQYANNKNLFGLDFVFYIQCAYVDFDCEINLLEFLIKNFPFLWIDCAETSYKVLKEIKEKICILFDNLSYSDLHPQSPSEISPKKKNISTGRKFLWKILAREELPKAKVLISFRPLAFTKFEELNKNTSLSAIYIYGLSKNNQNIICKTVSKNNSQAIMEYIYAYKNLASFCSVTTNCYAIMQTLNQYSSDLFFSIPLTKVLISSFVLIITSYGLKEARCDLHYTIISAWNDFLNQQAKQPKDTVTTDQIRYTKVLDIFLQINFKKSLTTNLKLLFSAITTDCFVAMYLFYFHKSFDDFAAKLLKPEILKQNSFYKEIMRFLFGLCNKSVVKFLEKLLPNHNYIDKSRVLKLILMDILEDLPSQKSTLYVIFTICSLVFEMHDDQFTKEVANCLPDFIILTNNIEITDIPGFTYVFLAREEKPLIIVETSDLPKKVQDWFTRAKEKILKSKGQVNFKHLSQSKN